MKKILSLLLVTVLAFSTLLLVGCGVINENEVSILWSGNGVVEVPGSLINSMERAMYIKNVSYKHYGANGDADTQLKQAKDALNRGTAALVIELVSDNVFELAASQLIASEIVNMAKEKDVPVVFFNCSVDKYIVQSYDRCVSVFSDTSTIADVSGELIASYVKENFKKLDKAEEGKKPDGKISYVFRDTGLISAAAVKRANELLATEDYTVKTADGEKINTEIVLLLSLDDKLTSAELILTESDDTAAKVLTELQKDDFNTDKLTTRFIPIVTVGEDFDYKSKVLENRPEIPENLVIKDTDDSSTVKSKNKEIKKLEDLMAYYEANKYLVDLTAVNESELGEMVYTTANVIGAGRIAGSAVEDKDNIAIVVAGVVRNLILGDDTFDGIANDSADETSDIVIEGSFVKIRYIAYVG
jgi:hypothetical protein